MHAHGTSGWCDRQQGHVSCVLGYINLDYIFTRYSNLCGTNFKKYIDKSNTSNFCLVTSTNFVVYILISKHNHVEFNVINTEFGLMISWCIRISTNLERANQTMSPCCRHNGNNTEIQGMERDFYELYRRLLAWLSVQWTYSIFHLIKMCYWRPESKVKDDGVRGMARDIVLLSLSTSRRDSTSWLTIPEVRRKNP